MKTPRETIDYRGCKICIQQDIDAQNPFETFDCEPPLLVLGLDDRNPTAYNNAPEAWGDILALLPPSCFERGKRLELIKRLDCTLKEFAEENRNMGTIDALVEFLTMQFGSTPSGWQSAKKWFEAAVWILKWGGITATYKTSMGYSQGDATLCLATATPAWVELTGAPADTHKRQMEEAIKLYGYWAWGDVYGFTCEDEGEELEEIGSSVWGFYGDNHEESGLIEAAQGHIDWHLEQKAKQEAEEARKEAETISELTAAFTF